jgi:hypothetical protein
MFSDEIEQAVEVCQSACAERDIGHRAP